MISPGETLFKLAAKSKIDEIYLDIEDEKGINTFQLKKDIENISVKY